MGGGAAGAVFAIVLVIAGAPDTTRAAQPVRRELDVPLDVGPPPEPADEPSTSSPELDVAPQKQPESPAELAPLEDESGDAIHRRVVVGSLFDAEELPRVAGSVTVVGERDLDQREYDDVHRVVQSVPGVYVRNEDGFGLRPNIGMRGANPERAAKLTLMEDEISIAPAPYSAPAIFHFPLTTRFVGIEVVKGPSLIRYGPRTIAGAINFRTREIPDEHTMVADVAGGRFGYAKGHAFYGTTHRGFGVLIEAAHVQSNGFKKIDGGGDSGFRANDTMMKLAYTTQSDHEAVHRIELKGGFANEHTHETYLGLGLDDFEAAPYRRYAASRRDNIELWRALGELVYTVDGEQLALETRVYRHDADRLWHRLDRFREAPGLSAILNDPDAAEHRVFAAILRGEADTSTPEQALVFRNNDWRTVSQGARATLRWRRRWQYVQQDLEASAGVHGDSIRRHTIEDAFLMTGGELVREDSPRVDALRNRGETVAGIFHVWDTVTFVDRVMLSGGVRVEVVSMGFRDPYMDLSGRRLDVPVSPALGALVRATGWLDVFAGVHRGFSPVAPGQPKSVKYEQSLSYELGVRGIYRGLLAEVTGYFNDYRNLNGTCTFGPDCGGGDDMRMFNAGKASIGGLESMIRWRQGFARAKVHVDAGAQYTFTSAQFRDAFHSDFGQWGDVVPGDRLPYVPEHVVGGNVGVGGRIWEVSLRPYWQGAMRDVAGQGPVPVDERIEGFFLLDASAEVRPLERLQLYLQLGNLTGNAYAVSRRPYGLRPGAPLTAIAGVKLFVMP